MIRYQRQRKQERCHSTERSAGSEIRSRGHYLSRPKTDADTGQAAGWAQQRAGELPGTDRSSGNRQRVLGTANRRAHCKPIEEVPDLWSTGTGPRLPQPGKMGWGHSVGDRVTPESSRSSAVMSSQSQAPGPSSPPPPVEDGEFLSGETDCCGVNVSSKTRVEIESPLCWCWEVGPLWMDVLMPHLTISGLVCPPGCV